MLTLHGLQAWLHTLRHKRPRAHGPIVSRCARDAYGRAERGRAFDRRSRANLHGLRPLLLQVPHTRACRGRCLRERPLLSRKRPREAAADASSQHTCKARGEGQSDAWKWPIHSRPTASRLFKAYGRRTIAEELHWSSRRSEEMNPSSRRAGGAWQPSAMPSAEQGCTTWDEATRVPTRRRIAAKAMPEQLVLLASMRRAPLRHRRGSKTGRY